MSWMTGLGWKDGLTGIQIQKVEELEKNLTKANNNVNQKQMLIDGLNQTLDKLKRKKEEDQKESGSLQYELTKVQKVCQELEDKNQALRAELKTKETKLVAVQDHLEKTTKQLENATANVKRLEEDKERSACPPTPGGNTVASTTRRSSVTPLKRESIKIGTSLDIDPMERIAELEKKLSEREQETKDLEVKLFEASFTTTTATFDEDAPLPGRQRTASRSLFDEEPLPTRKNKMHEDNGFMNTKTDKRTNNIASRHKGSSISFGYNTTPPDQRKMNKISSTNDVFKTPSAKISDFSAKEFPQNQCMTPYSKNTAQNDDFVSKSNSNKEPIFTPSKDDKQIKDYKKQLAEAQQTLEQLELKLKSKESEVQELRLDLGTAQSQLEQLKVDLKKKDTEQNKTDSTISKIQLELEAQTSKAEELETKISRLQQENQCHIHNAEATKQALETKLKHQEKELKNETSQAQNNLVLLNREMDDIRKQLVQEKNAARDMENSLKVQLEKLEAEKSKMDRLACESTSKINQLENEVSTKERLFEEGCKKLEAITKEKNDAVSRCEQIQNKGTSLQQDLEAQKMELDSKDSLVTSLTEKFNDKVKECETLMKCHGEEGERFRKQIQELTDAKEKAESELSDYKCSTKDKMDKIHIFESETIRAKEEVDAMTEKVRNMEQQVEKAESVKQNEIMKAEKAIAEKMTSELKQWELDENVKKLDEEQKILIEKNTKLELQFEASNKVEDELRTLIEQNKNEIQAKTDTNKDLEIKVLQYESKTQLLENDILKLKEENDGQNKTIVDSKCKLELLQKKECSLLKEFEALNQEKQHLEVQNKFAFEETEMKKIEIEKIEKQLHDHSDAIKEKNSFINNLNTQISELELINAKNEREIEYKTKTIEENVEIIKKLESEVKILNNKIEYLKSKSLKSSDDLKNAEHELSVRRAESSDLNNELSEYKTKVTELTDDIDMKENKISELNANIKMKEHEYAEQMKEKNDEGEKLMNILKGLEKSKESLQLEKEQLTKEIEKQEITLKEKKLDLSCAQAKILDLKQNIEEHDSKISTLEIEALKNEESYKAQYEEMTFKINDLMRTIEDVNEKLYKAIDDFEQKEKEKKEIDCLLKTKENECSQLSVRFDHLQSEFEELQMEKACLSKNNDSLTQNIANLRTEKEEGKEFIEVLQKQNDELNRQNDESSSRLRHNEDVTDNLKEKINDLERALSSVRKSFEEKQERVDILEKEADRMANCIVELEQKCGLEKTKSNTANKQVHECKEIIVKLKDSEAELLQKIDDLEDAASYDKENIVQLETEICHLKQAKSKIESNKEKLKDKLNRAEEKLHTAIKQVEEYQREISETSTNNESLMENERLKSIVAEKEKEITKLNSFIDDMEKVYDEQEMKIKESQESIHQILDENKSLKAYRESIEIEIDKNQVMLTEHSEKFQNMESELELMKIDVQNKDVSIITLHKQLVEEKETLAEYISKLNISLDETRKEMTMKNIKVEEFMKENSALESQILILKQNEKSFSNKFASIQEDILKREKKIALLETDICEKEILITQLRQTSADNKMEELLREKDGMISSMSMELTNVKESLNEKIKKLSILENETEDKFVNILKEKEKLEIILDKKKEELKYLTSEYDMKINGFETERVSFVERIESLRAENSKLIDTQREKETFIKQIQNDLSCQLTEKNCEITRLQKFHSSSLSQVQEHLTDTKTSLQKVLEEKYEIENDVIHLQKEKDELQQEVSRLQKDYEKEIDLKEILKGESEKIKAECDYFINECKVLQEEISSKEVILSHIEEENKVLHSNLTVVMKELSDSKDKFEEAVNEKLQPFESEMNCLQIEIDEKEKEILKLESKLEGALKKIEKTVEINKEIVMCLNEKSSKLEEAFVTIDLQKKAVEEKEELLFVLNEKEEIEINLKKEIDLMKELALEKESANSSLLKRIEQYDFEREKLGDEKQLIEKEVTLLQKDLEDEQAKNISLQSKHEIVLQKYEKLKMVEVQIEDLHQENEKLLHLKDALETKVESLEKMQEKLHEEIAQLRKSVEHSASEVDSINTKSNDNRNIHTPTLKHSEKRKQTPSDKSGIETVHKQVPTKLTSDNISKSEKSCNSQIEKKHSDEIISDLKSKLNLAINNAKKLEIEYSDLDSLLQRVEREKSDLKNMNENLNVQISALKEEIQSSHIETEKSIKNPWEAEEWEGLSACEIYDLMKYDLVPAQQARLSALCIQELEKKLEENQEMLMKFYSDKEEMKSERSRLDAKICFLENSASNSLSESNRSQSKVLLNKESVTINRSFINDISTDTDFQTPENNRSLRRSSRSASKLANISICKSSTPNNDTGKLPSSNIENDINSEKRVKVKVTDTDSPAKTVRVNKKINKSKLVDYSLGERDPLTCVTNSPIKRKESLAKTKDEQLHSRNQLSRGKSENVNRENPEECKQQ